MSRPFAGLLRFGIGVMTVYASLIVTQVVYHKRMEWNQKSVDPRRRYQLHDFDGPDPDPSSWGSDGTLWYPDPVTQKPYVFHHPSSNLKWGGHSHSP